MLGVYDVVNLTSVLQRQVACSMGLALGKDLTFLLHVICMVALCQQVSTNRAACSLVAMRYACHM
jgi:hypothetical protein